VSKFLLDANISSKIGDFLQADFGFDVESILGRGLGQIPDEEVIAIAKREQRVIITFDKDFGEAYYLRDRGTIGIITLSLSDQRTESMRQVLIRFFTTEAQHIDLDISLVILEETRVRIMR
jgi:predicted nuclease of predicted toxin-antitoxin system